MDHRHGLGAASNRWALYSDKRLTAVPGAWAEDCEMITELHQYIFCYLVAQQSGIPIELYHLSKEPQDILAHVRWLRGARFIRRPPEYPSYIRTVAYYYPYPI